MHINAAMFETTGRSGYVLKPKVMWDSTHEKFSKFNPLDKDFVGTQLSALTLTVS